MKHNENYAFFPLILITDEKYKALTSNEKILYVLFLNRLNYSRNNLIRFSDEKGVFIYYSNKSIQTHLNCTGPTITAALNNLQKAGLICKEYQKRGLPLKIYVNDIRDENGNVYSAHKQPQDKFSYKSHSYSDCKEKTDTNHFEGNGWQGNTEGEKLLTQAQINRRTFGNKKNNRHSHKENLNYASHEKEVSFDVEKAEEMELKHLYHFAEKKQKRRTRNPGPTM